MIYVGENKALLCKGDFHPAELYKGDTKIAGYTLTEFEGENGVTLENCYNDKIYDVQLNGKNLLDVKKHYGKYANEYGGITLHTGELTDFVFSQQKSLTGVFKEKTPYTLSFKYNITEATTYITAQFFYTDGTTNRLYIGQYLGNYGDIITLPSEGTFSYTSNGYKTVNYFNFSYGTNTKTLECELTEMQIEEGTAATDYEPPCREATVTVRGKNILDMSKQAVTQGYYLDSSGDATTSNSRFIKISPIAVDPSTQYTISIGSKHYLYTIWFCTKMYETSGISRMTAFDQRKRTFTTPENCTYIRVSIDSGSVAVPEDLEWAMLEKGSGDGIYEPYIEPQTITLENGLLAADIPTFKGTTVIELESDIAATISGKYKKIES